MTVYVDDFRIPARVGRYNARWSHLFADTRSELHAFAAQIGLRCEWFQDDQHDPRLVLQPHAVMLCGVAA